MERSEFLSKLSIGMVAACAGCSLVSCGSSSKRNDPTPTGGGNPPPAGSGNLFAVDLSSQLVNVGDSIVKDGVILARIAADNTAASFTAVQSACTHQGTTIGYNVSQGIFICPLHGSEFSTSGKVILGPAASPLQKYTVNINNSTLTVSA